MKKVLVNLVKICWIISSVVNSHGESEELSPAEINSSGCGCGGNKMSRNSEIIDISNHLMNKSQSGKNSVVIQLNSKMVFIKGGDGVVGTDKPIMKGDGESPKRKVSLSSFYLDKYEVSNDDFKSFVDQTGFVTESEHFGWSFVFESAIADDIKKDITSAVLGAEWWLPVNGSYWREPEGPGSDVFSSSRNRGNYAVVHLSWNDAVQYCRWRGGRLPTEAEWEYAAKGRKEANSGKSPSLFPWGNSLTPHKEHRANIFQGSFPAHNSVEDGFEHICPVDAFPPQNDYGLHNMIGNVWEWVEDWFTVDHGTEGDLETELRNPTGPSLGREKVKKGGSFLCHKSFCYRYRTAARFPSTPDSATYNVGVRCAMDAESRDGPHDSVLEKANETEWNEDEL